MDIMDIKAVFIDIETLSKKDLKKVGVYKYSEDDNFKIILTSYIYMYKDGTFSRTYLSDNVPEEIENLLKDKDNSIKFFAFNSEFERICFSRHLKGTKSNTFISPFKFVDLQTLCAYLGLPTNLDKASEFISNNKEEQKLKNGKNLIQKIVKMYPILLEKGIEITLENLLGQDNANDFRKYSIQDTKIMIPMYKYFSKYFMHCDPYIDYDTNNGDSGIFYEQAV